MRRATSRPRGYQARLLAGLMLACAVGRGAAAQTPEISDYRPGVEPRWASPENPTGAKGQGGRENWGAKGHAFETVPAGASLILADIRGAGTIRRLWLTVSDRSPEMLRALKFEIYWDDAATPAVAAPLGDFFGAGLGQLVPFENALFASPEGRSFVSYVPMPFRTHARLMVTNESDHDLPALFYDVDYTRVAHQPATALYFHAHWRRERPTRLGEAFRLLPRVTGRGRYLGASIGVRPDSAYGTTWWGEGEAKIYLDGDRATPTLVGTGTEDYIGSGWGQGAYVNRYQGAPVADEKARRWTFYRYHIPDPIYFAQDCEVALQQIGGGPRPVVVRLQAAGVPLRPVTIDAGGRPKFYQLLDSAAVPLTNSTLRDGWTNFYRADDVSATAYFYLDRPEDGLPRLAPAAERVAGLR